MSDMNEQDQLKMIPTEDHDDLDEPEVIEAYCVKCKHMVEMESPEPVWTSKGTPGTRGICPECGTTVFRMGKTEAHGQLVRPAAVKVEGSVKIATSGDARRLSPPPISITRTPMQNSLPGWQPTSKMRASIRGLITGQVGSQDVKWAAASTRRSKTPVRMSLYFSPTARIPELLRSLTFFFKTQKKPVVLALTGLSRFPIPYAVVPA